MSREKYWIMGTDINKYHIELSDLDERYLVPECKEPEYVEVMNRLIEEGEIEFLHAQPDQEVLKIASSRDQLKAKTFLPDVKTLETCQDKMLTMKTFDEADVPIAESYLIRDEEELFESIDKLLADGNKSVWLRATHGAGSKAALPVTKFKQARAWIQYWSTSKGIGYGSFMASEYLPGKDYAWTSLWKDGKLIVSQGRERLFYLYGFLSPSGTSSTPSVARTIHNREVNAICTRAVKAIDSRANGIFCVDLKENKEGMPCVTEINAGRFFTTSNFYTHAGCNMPEIYVKLGMGEEVDSFPLYDVLPEGLYWIRMVDMGYRLVKEGEWRSLSAAQASPKRLSSAPR